MLKIITLNCQKAHQKGCSDFLQKLLDSEEYDFILLQEANKDVHKVVSKNLQEYSLISSENNLTNSHHEICLIYRSEFNLIKKEFLNFSSSDRKMLTQSGSAIGLFELNKEKSSLVNKKYILIGSLHLQSSYHVRTRQAELRKIKMAFQNLGENFDTIKIIGGDFNNLIAGEKYLNDANLKPELVYASNFDDYTHDSGFLEKAHLEKPLSKLLLIDKLKYKVKIDHYYVDAVNFCKYDFISETLKFDISDHRPVIMKISKK